MGTEYPIFSQLTERRKLLFVVVQSRKEERRVNSTVESNSIDKRGRTSAIILLPFSRRIPLQASPINIRQGWKLLIIDANLFFGLSEFCTEAQNKESQK